MPKPQYGRDHRERRAAWQAYLIGAGPVACGCTGQCRHHVGRCSTLVTAESDWHLGHGVAVRDGGDGSDSTPWCRPCNLRDAAAATNGVQLVRAGSRDW